MAWSTSDRKERLPANWDAIRAKVKRRARGHCEAVRHEPACEGIGSHCDHIDHGDDHRLGNLQWLSKPCHDAKTRVEAAEAHGIERPGCLPSEDHPGKVGVGIPYPHGVPDCG